MTTDDALHRPVVRAHYSRLLVDLLEEEGVPAATSLDGTGLADDELTGDDARISHVQQLRVYENALRHSKRPGLGYRLGRRQRISDHGVLGYAILSSASLAQALRISTRYLATIGPLLTMELLREGDTAIIAFREVTPLGRARRMAREEALLVILRNLLGLSDPPTVPFEVRLDLPSADRARDGRELGCRVRYGCDRTEIRFRAEDLSRPMSFSDEETARVCERRCAEILERMGGQSPLVADVRRVLLSDPGRFPTLDEASRSLGMSGRTLRRRLTEEGQSFRAIATAVRQELAIDYLRDSRLTLDEIAAILGYTATQNFHRAFKQWTGRSPGAYR